MAQVRSVYDRGITTVRIFGKEYPVASDQNPEYVRMLAAYVDEKMNEVAGGAETATSSRVAVLAALMIADEYMRLKSEKEKFIGLVEGRVSKVIKMVEERLAQ
jgi:cell division protein ZapA